MDLLKFKVSSIASPRFRRPQIELPYISCDSLSYFILLLCLRSFEYIHIRNPEFDTMDNCLMENFKALNVFIDARCFHAFEFSI